MSATPSDPTWFVPGVGIAVPGRATVRLWPPEDWRREILVLPRRPPSMNDNKLRSNWRGFHTQKKSWQEEIEQLLMVARTPRNGQRALAGAYVRFERRMSRPPDPGNYAGLVNKALGDGLVSYGAIPDDDAEHYMFGGVEFDTEVGSPETRIVVYFQPAESADG